MRAFLCISALIAATFTLAACGEPEPIDPPPGMQDMQQQPAQQDQAPGQDMPSADDDPMAHPYGTEDEQTRQQDQY